MSQATIAAGRRMSTARCYLDPIRKRQNDQVALPAGFDTQDAEATVRVVECDALDQTGQDLGWRARSG
jgi:hypothetical protein